MKIEDLQKINNLVEKLKKDSDQLKNEILSLKIESFEEKNSINNLKKMSFSFLDIFISMQKQINLLINLKKFNKNLNRR